MGRTREFSSEEKLKIKQVLLAPIPLPENKKFFLAITNGFTARSAAFVSGVKNGFYFFLPKS